MNIPQLNNPTLTEKWTSPQIMYNFQFSILQGSMCEFTTSLSGEDTVRGGSHRRVARRDCLRHSAVPMRSSFNGLDFVTWSAELVSAALKPENSGANLQGLHVTEERQGSNFHARSTRRPLARWSLTPRGVLLLVPARFPGPHRSVGREHVGHGWRKLPVVGPICQCKYWSHSTM